MKPIPDSASLLYGFARERAIEWAQDYLTVPAVRGKIIGLLNVLAERSGDIDLRRFWSLTNDGALVFARDHTIFSLRPNVTFGPSGLMDQTACATPSTFTVISMTMDKAEANGSIEAKFHFTHAELNRVFKAFDRSGLVHVLYDERALLEATRCDRLDAALEAFLTTA